MIFDGYVKDIKTSFKNVFGSEPKTVDELNMINVILFATLKSYYFQENYKYAQIGVSENGETFINYLNNRKIEEEKIGNNKLTLNRYFRDRGDKYHKNDSIDINDFPYQYSASDSSTEKVELHKINLTKLPDDCLKVIEDLKNNELYNVLFEESEIKKKIILKYKKEFKYTVVPQTEIEYFLKNNFKIQNLKIDDIYKSLNNNYDLRFFSREREGYKDDVLDKPFYAKLNQSNKNFVVFAHNDYEIAGICPVNKNLNFKNMLKTDNFFNVTSVMVASNARGNGIGVKLFEKALEEAEQRNICLVRTSATDQGRNFLKENIDKLIKNSSVPVLDAEHVNYLYIPIRKILESSKNKDNQKNKILNLINDIREQQLKTYIKKSEAKSIDEVYAAEDAEVSFLQSLENREYGLKSLFKLK